MIKIYCNICDKYRKLKIYIFQKTLGLPIVCSKYGHEYKQIFKEKESTEILKISRLIYIIEESIRKYIFTTEENISQ